MLWNFIFKKEDAIFALGLDVDWMALSFVRTPEDLRMLRDLIDQHSEYRVPVIAKIAITAP